MGLVYEIGPAISSGRPLPLGGMQSAGPTLALRFRTLPAVSVEHSCPAGQTESRRTTGRWPCLRPPLNRRLPTGRQRQSSRRGAEPRSNGAGLQRPGERIPHGSMQTTDTAKRLDAGPTWYHHSFTGALPAPAQHSRSALFGAEVVPLSSSAGIGLLRSDSDAQCAYTWSCTTKSSSVLRVPSGPSDRSLYPPSRRRYLTGAPHGSVRGPLQYGPEPRL